MKAGQESSKKDLYIGIGNVKPLIFNPTREQLNSLLDYTPEENKEQEELVYLTEDYELKDKDGNVTGNCKKVAITCWVEEQKTKMKYPIYFNLLDIADISESGKTLFLNQQGKSMYSDTKANLKENFTHTPGKIKEELQVKEAKKGERQFLAFLSSWIKPNPFNTEANLFPENTKKFWAGDMSEVNSLLSERDTNTVLVNFYVKTVEKDGESKEVQRLSTKGFCSGSYLPQLRNYITSGIDSLQKDTKIGKQSMYDLWKFLSDNFGEYGIKDAVTLKGELTVYTPGMTTPEAKTEAVDPASASY